LALAELIPTDGEVLCSGHADCSVFYGYDNYDFDGSGDSGNFGHLAPMGQDNFVELVEQQSLSKLAVMTDDHGFEHHNNYDNDDGNDNDDFESSGDYGIFGHLAPVGADLGQDVVVSLENFADLGQDVVVSLENFEVKDGVRERLSDIPDYDSEPVTEELADLRQDVVVSLENSVATLIGDRFARQFQNDARQDGVLVDSEPETEELADLGQDVVVSLENFADLGQDVVLSLENSGSGSCGDLAPPVLDQLQQQSSEADVSAGTCLHENDGFGSCGDLASPVLDQQQPDTEDADLGRDVVVSLENFADLGQDVVVSLENPVAVLIGCDCSVCTVLTVWGFPSSENMFYGGDPFPVCGCGLCSCVRNFTERISRTIDSMQNEDARGCGDLFRGEYISAVGLAVGEGVALCANRHFWDLLSHDGLIEILAGFFARNMANLSDILRVAPLAQRPGLFTNSVKHMADFTTGALQQVWDQAVRAGSSDAL
jgi:hypothetical protein